MVANIRKLPQKTLGFAVKWPFIKVPHEAKPTKTPHQEQKHKTNGRKRNQSFQRPVLQIKTVVSLTTYKMVWHLKRLGTNLRHFKTHSHTALCFVSNSRTQEHQRKNNSSHHFAKSITNHSTEKPWFAL